MAHDAQLRHVEVRSGLGFNILYSLLRLAEFNFGKK